MPEFDTFPSAHNDSNGTRSPKVPRDRSTPWRRARLVRARYRLVRWHIVRRLALFSGWVWVAAISLVGFEMFEVIFGAFLLAPEFLPLVIIAFALAWVFRERVRRLRLVVRVRVRLARARRSQTRR